VKRGMSDIELVKCAVGDSEAEADGALDALYSLAPTPALELVRAFLVSDHAMAISDRGLFRSMNLLSEMIEQRGTEMPAINAAIRCVGDLFMRRFSAYKDDPYETVYMAWDILCHPWRLHKHIRAAKDTVLQELQRCLAIDNRLCQLGALHGLGHVREPEAKEIISEFLRGDRPPDIRDFAERALRGRVQ
jgi:hypothetical protein